MVIRWSPHTLENYEKYSCYELAGLGRNIRIGLYVHIWIDLTHVTEVFVWMWEDMSTLEVLF